jgi:hypothetical protein
MSVTVTLRQEKITLSDKFVSVSWITLASPTGYYPLFVVSENIGDPTDERFERVATLNDLATYVENPLQLIRSSGAFKSPPLSSAPVVGDILEITNAPDYWFDTYLTVAKFEVVEVDPSGNWMAIDAGAPFPTALDTVAWTLRNAAETVTRGSGTGAQVTREVLTGDTTYLRRHLTRTFTEVKAASDHVEAISSFVKALIDDANEDADQFSGVETEVIS